MQGHPRRRRLPRRRLVRHGLRDRRPAVRPQGPARRGRAADGADDEGRGDDAGGVDGRCDRRHQQQARDGARARRARQHEGRARQGAAREHVPVRLGAALSDQGPRLVLDEPGLVRARAAQRGEGAALQVPGQLGRGRRVSELAHPLGKGGAGRGRGVPRGSGVDPEGQGLSDVHVGRERGRAVARRDALGRACAESGRGLPNRRATACAV
mmetsp:Transcript_7447/g.12560  ORF Transcript_7447/g.12560 Transcript_7447/m.12560 type:complete len:211 (-) Transcript_7447:160-792(-)